MRNFFRITLLKRIPILLFLAFYLALSIGTFKHYGLTMDEFFVYTRGKYFYTKVRGNDALLQKGFAVKDRKNEDLLYNNSSYAAVLYALNDNESYEGYHLLNLLIASVLFYAFFEVLLYLFKKPWLALIGPVFLFLTPRFFGAIPANPKDVPYAIAYFLSLILIFASRAWNDKLRILSLGILIGLAASLRFIGFSLVAVYDIFLFILPYAKKQPRMAFFDISLELLMIGLIAFFVFIVNMPYVAADPFNHFIELVSVAKSFPWYGTVLLFGNAVPIEQRPWYYLFLWIVITTPLFILFFFFKVITDCFDYEKKLFVRLLLISLAVQVGLYLLLKPVVYNGLRHYLFLLPHIVMISAIGFITTLSQKKWRLYAILFVLINGAIVGMHYLKLHPYEYTYFNEAIGGVAGAKGKFEIDYWGASDKEAFMVLKNHLQKTGEKNVAVFSCSKSASLSYYLPEVRDVNTNIKKADYIVCYDGILNDQIAKEFDTKRIGTVERESVPYSYIFKILH